MWGSSARPGPLVEDDEAPREMTVQMLELRGFDLLPGKDAADAITTCRVHEGETDPGPPGVPGGEPARSAYVIRPRTEIVVNPGIPRDIAIRKGLIKPGAPLIPQSFATGVPAGTPRAVPAGHDAPTAH